jgi:pyrroloquinoline quinone (PQQ) biosynthesis protein C
VLPALRAAGTRFLTAEPADAVYRGYLTAMHATVRASAPLMEAALVRAEELAASDPVAARLVAYLPRHIVEEADHDGWLLEDLSVTGAEPERVRARPPSERVAAVVGAQYYWIAPTHPVALLGYMAALESNAPSTEVITRLIDRTGFERAAFRTIIEHADLDEGHADDVFRIVDDLPLDDDLGALLGMSARHTVAGMAAVFDEVTDRAAGGGLAHARRSRHLARGPSCVAVRGLTEGQSPNGSVLVAASDACSGTSGSDTASCAM